MQITLRNGTVLSTKRGELKREVIILQDGKFMYRAPSFRVAVEWMEELADELDD